MLDAARPLLPHQLAAAAASLPLYSLLMPKRTSRPTNRPTARLKLGAPNRGGWVSSRAAFDDHKLDDDVDEVVGIGSCYWYQATRSQQHRWGPPVFGGGGRGASSAPFSFGNNLKQASSSSSFSGILLVEHVAVLGAVFRPTSSIIIVCQNQSGIVMTGGRPLLADY